MTRCGFTVAYCAVLCNSPLLFGGCIALGTDYAAAFQNPVVQHTKTKSFNSFSFHPLTRSQQAKTQRTLPNNMLKNDFGRLQIITKMSQLSNDVGQNDAPAKNTETRATMVYALMLCSLGVFLVDKVFHYPIVRQQLYFSHYRWKWWQPLSSCFCHGNFDHLSNNMFLLLLFGRSVEDDLGWGGLLFSFVFCGVSASLVSLLLLPKSTVSIGASGAVFGLFAVSTLAKLSWTGLFTDWRKLAEFVVLGHFVFRQVASEIATTAGGGVAGVNHVAHLSGAVAGAVMVKFMQITVDRFERNEKKRMDERANRRKKMNPREK